jgi:hypothetical protein
VIPHVRQGVVFATGGIEHNEALRERFLAHRDNDQRKEGSFR